MQTIYIGNTLINDVMLGSQRMDDVLTNGNIPKQIPLDGLMAYYDATIASSYNGSGTTWFDISGNGRNMVPLSGSTFPTWDAADKEFDFNGTSNALAITPAFVTSSITDLTQVAWVRLASNKVGNTNAGGFIGIQNREGNNQWNSMAYGDQGTGWTMASSNGDQPVSSGDTEATTDYVLIVGTRASGTNNYKIWRNGANEIGASTFTPKIYSDTIFTVGANFLRGIAPLQFSAFFSGSLSMCAFYNRVLTTTEIDSIYNAGRL
jgi:hypothetical protein